jgi:hypothetical protein
MSDQFQGHETGLTTPAVHASDIVPSDAVALPFASRAIYVGTAGNLRVQLISGDTVTLTNVQTGAYYPLRVAQVLATGTTAAGLVALR